MVVRANYAHVRRLKAPQEKQEWLGVRVIGRYVKREPLKKGTVRGKSYRQVYTT